LFRLAVAEPPETGVCRPSGAGPPGPEAFPQVNARVVDGGRAYVVAIRGTSFSRRKARHDELSTPVGKSALHVDTREHVDHRYW
jgi:hypothetical protein